jgi:hypothetical protein
MNQDSRTIEHVMRDIKSLSEYQIQITIPEGFRFSGVVPFDMNIVAGEAFVTVVAPSWDEAVLRVQDFFKQPQ